MRDTIGAQVRRTVSALLYALYAVVTLYAVAANAVLVGGILGVPILIFLGKAELSTERLSTLVRREFITLISLDIAITQHFFLLSGYGVGAVLLSTVYSWLTPPRTAEYLLSWGTLTPAGQPPSTVATQLLSVTLAIYGTVGIALVASIVITTYTRVLREFDISDEDLILYMVEADADPGIDEPTLADFPGQTVKRNARDLVWDEFETIADENRFGNPVLGRVWTWLRFRETLLRAGDRARLVG